MTSESEAERESYIKGKAGQPEKTTKTPLHLVVAVCGGVGDTSSWCLS